jgi:hypothetical protein
MIDDRAAIFLSGAPRGSPVVRLNDNTDVGQALLRVAADTSATFGAQQPWKAGDRIAIALTDWHPTQTEYHTIVACLMLW